MPGDERTLEEAAAKFRELRDTGDLDAFAENLHENQLSQETVPVLDVPLKRLEYGRAQVADLRAALAAGQRNRKGFQVTVNGLQTVTSSKCLPTVPHDALLRAIEDLASIARDEYGGDELRRMYTIEADLERAQTILQTYDDALRILEAEEKVTRKDPFNSPNQQSESVSDEAAEADG